MRNKKKKVRNKVTVFMLSAYPKCSENHHSKKLFPDDLGHMGLQYYSEFTCWYWGE
jgi:hypothetical protein